MKVRDLKRFLRDHGWTYAYSRGDHHQYIHPAKPAKVTVCGHRSDEVTRRLEASILKQAGLTKQDLLRWQNR
jgi:predicted RNA binding protein YcfA (HicA-like mRNA interferase family)